MLSPVQNVWTWRLLSHSSVHTVNQHPDYGIFCEALESAITGPVLCVQLQFITFAFMAGEYVSYLMAQPAAGSCPASGFKSGPHSLWQWVIAWEPCHTFQADFSSSGVPSAHLIPSSCIPSFAHHTGSAKVLLWCTAGCVSQDMLVQLL